MKQKSTKFVKYNVMKKFFVLVLFISIGIAQEKLILQQADLLQASVVNEETVTKLSGNIIFKKSDSVLKSNFATQYDKSPLVKLNDNVVVTQENQTIYCDSLIYNKNTEAFSMYGNVRIDSDQRSMQSQEAQIDDKNEQIVLINDCEINEDNKHKIYGDKIILYFKNNELINFEVLSKGKVFTTNTGYEKKDENTQDLVKIENENLLQAKHIFGEIKDNEINQLYLNGMASTFIHLYDDSLYQGNNAVSGDSISIKIENDSANKLVASGGTIGKYVPNKSNSNITEPINYSADVIEFEMDTQISKLYGSSKILHEDIDLSASHVNVNWETNILEAFTNNPLNQEENNRPILVEGNREPMVGDEMIYNLNTKKGKILRGESQVQENMYMGKQITSITDSTFYIDDCIFTSCDPSKFYLGSKKVKIIYGDKVIAKPLNVYIGGVPIIGVPLAIFPHSSKERRSGWIMPSFGSSDNRGTYMDGLGYYFAPNDYFGSEILLGFADRQGLIIKAKNNYKKRYKFSGALNIETRRFLSSNEQDIAKINENNQTDYVFNWNHNQILRNNQTFRANASYYSNGQYNRQTSIDPVKRLNQQAISNITYTKRWKKSNISISANVSNKQDLMASSKIDSNSSFYQNPSNSNSTITENTSTLPSLNMNVSRRKLFKNFSQDSWLGNIQWNYSSRLLNNRKSYYESEEIINSDGMIEYRWRENSNGDVKQLQKIDGMLKNNFSINAPFTIFQYIAINPRININSDFVNRYRIAELNESNEIAFTYKDKMRNRTTGNFGLSLSTKIYGILPIKFGDIESVRHVLTPTIGFNYSPDYQNNRDYFQEIGDELYDYFQGSLIGSTPITSSKQVSLSLNNVFQAKVQKDDQKEEKINFLNWRVSTGYNFNADEFKLGKINTSLRSQIKNGVSVDINFTHDPYKFDKENNTRINELDSSPRMVSARLATNFNLNRKSNNEGDEGKEFSDSTKKFINDLSTTNWNSRIGVSYTINKFDPSNTIKNFWINTNTSINITQNWKLNYNARFNARDKSIIRHNVTLYREIDCWEFFVDWTPNGYAKGLYFRLNLKSDILKDLKVERRQGLYSNRSNF